MTFKLKTLIATALLLAAPALMTAPAFAHAMPIKADPEFNSTLKAPLPAEIRVQFSEPFEIAFTKVIISGGDGTEVGIGALSVDAADPRVLIVPLPAMLPVGELTVTWSTVATDTHKSQGKFHFIVAK